MTTTANKGRRARPRTAPRPTGVRVRRQWRLIRRWSSRRAKKVAEVFARGHRGVEKPPRWRVTWKKGAAKLVFTAGAIALLLLVIRSLVVIISGKPSSFPFGFDPDSQCVNTDYSCGVTSGIAMTFLSLAFATAVFLLYRLDRVRRPVVRRAQNETRDFVQSAGTIFGSVVGREELCNVIMDDLRKSGNRRPHVLVGGVGVGKTAVLVELTKLLAENGAVPVPVRLRDAGDELDFTELARNRFMSAHSDGEAERAWRELLKDDQIVVVADGLEEALSATADGTNHAGNGDLDGAERDNRIRVAVLTAYRRRLPLVIASRPHDALVGLDAAEIELEPLGEEYAVEYVESGASTRDAHRLDWVIETAEVTETPLYLQIVHELQAKGLLERAVQAQESHLDTRGGDRVGLRVRLLETYINAVIEGYFYPEVPMSSRLREATITQLGVLACTGLRSDTIEVKFADVLTQRGTDGQVAAQARSRKELLSTGGRRDLYEAMEQAIRDQRQAEGLPGANGQKRVEEPDVERELRLAATRGVRLGLVEARDRGVRFPHSIMQAYLASRVLGCVVDNGAGLKAIPKVTGRTEIASPERSSSGNDPAQRPSQPDKPSEGGEKRNDFLAEALENASREVLAALVMYSRRAGRQAGATRRANGAANLAWADSGDIRGRLVLRALEISNDAKRLDLFASALELDSVARAPRHGRYAKQLRLCWPPDSEDRTVEQTKLAVIARFAQAAGRMSERAANGDLPARRGHYPRPAWDELYRIACKDVWYPVRLAAVQQLANGADEAFDELRDHLGYDEPTLDGERVVWQEEAGHRELVLRGWLAPLLVASVKDKERSAAAQKNLEAWLAYIGGASNGEPAAPLALEIAVAQGLKHAANRRPGGSRAEAQVRAYLAEQAAVLLETSSFWFSRLTLVQALCLWALPDWAPDQKPPAQGDRRGRRASREREPERRGSDPAALVDHWLSATGDRREHPFVDAARDLAVLALQKGEPERYLWIDEAGVVSRIGSRRPRSATPRKHNLWIPPSTGWSALDPRAQRLVADVLILLNLAERGADPPAIRDRRLRQAMRDDLPACLTGERSYLVADRTVGMVERPTPGAGCKDGCHFDLCPYPPKGTSQIYRAELSEAFCRRQQVLLGRWFSLRRRTAQWQGALPGELKRFWIAMERRARR